MSIKIDNKEIESFKFPAGEWCVRVDEASIKKKDSVGIRAMLTSSDQIIKLLLTVDAIRRINPHMKIDLVLPYLPYARQDRVCNKGESFSLEVIADLLAQTEFRTIKIFHPHSAASKAALSRWCVSNLRVVELEDIINITMLQQWIIHTHDLTLVAPDKGAAAKVLSLAQEYNVNFLSADKVRNSQTGEIEGMTVLGAVQQGGSFLIIDDICDGGKTFTELGKLLKQQGAGDLYLYVTHGIFSKGTRELFKYFKQIFCCHTLYPLPKEENLLIIGGAVDRRTRHEN